MADKKTEEKLNRLENQISELKKRVGSGRNFSGNVKSRLESGEGFGEAFGGSIRDKITDVKEAFSPQGVKKLGRRAYLETFKGKDIFSAYMRGRLRKSELGKLPENEKVESAAGLEGGESVALLKIIAKNAISLHLMSRDMNVLRQNVVKMVKHQTKKGGKNKAVNRADAWFMREDEREAKLESERNKGKKTNLSPTPEKPKDECGGMCDTVMGAITNMLTKGLLAGVKAIFNPKNIMKVLGKVFVIGTILFSLFEGIMAGWDKWKETGDIGEAIKEGLAGMLDFLTLGLFGKDNIKKMFDTVTEFFQPIIDAIKDIYYSVKDWIANNIGVPEISIPIPKWMQKLGAPEKISIGPWYPFKDDPKSTEKQVTQREEKPKGEASGSVEQASASKSKDIGGDLTINSGDQGDVVNNFNALQKANQELQDLNVQYMREKISLVGSPNYDEAKVQLIQKYAPLIQAKQKEVESFAAKPGVKEMAKQQGLTISKSGILEEEKSSTSPTQETATTESAPPPSPSPAAGGETASASPTQSSSVEQDPSTISVPAPAGETTSPSAVGGGGASVPTEGGQAAPAAAAATASAPPASSDVTAPTEDTTPKPMTDTGVSGSELSTASSDVAEAQRMESAADMGSTINAPSTTNNKSSSSEGKPPIASAWDNVFLDFYAST